MTVLGISLEMWAGVIVGFVAMFGAIAFLMRKGF